MVYMLNLAVAMAMALNILTDLLLQTHYMIIYDNLIISERLKDLDLNIFSKHLSYKDCGMSILVTRRQLNYKNQVLFR